MGSGIVATIVAKLATAFFSAVAQAVVKYFEGLKHDADLKALGYTESQRDVAVAHVRSLDAATSARARVAIDLASNPLSVRRVDGNARPSRL